MIQKVDQIEINRIYKYYKMKTLSDETFVLLSSNDFIKILESGISLISQGNDVIDGLIIGHILDHRCFITMLIGESSEIKDNLLSAFELNVNQNDQIHELLIHFMNPISLSWYPIKNIIHPCYQGVGLDEENFILYSKQGYAVHSIQDTYYRELSSFKIPDDVRDHLTKNSTDGIEISFYDSKIHTGLIDFTEEIHAPHWKKVILDNEIGNPSLPLLVALKYNKVIGFTGPLKVESNGRGYFAGIGILESERGKKIGKCLFFMLCQHLKDMGADYMTLYTGNQNPARFIYLDAGFKVLKSFATMKKTI